MNDAYSHPDSVYIFISPKNRFASITINKSVGGLMEVIIKRGIIREAFASRRTGFTVDEPIGALLTW
jgi:hypothetical protein